MQLLCLLASRAPDPVSKEEIVRQVWRGMVVTDDAITQAVSRLRKQLNDDRREPRFIETVWKGGYRCIAPLKQARAERDGAANGWPLLRAAVLVAILAAGLIFGFWPSDRQPAAFVLDQQSFRAVTTFVGRERDPAIAPDGTRVAYVRKMPPDDNQELFVSPISGAPPLRLTTTPDDERSPVFSPDGSEIAYLRVSETGCRIVAMPAVGGPARDVADCQNNGFADLAWSPDGSTFALGGRASESEPYAIYLIDAISGDAEKISQPQPNVWGDYDPVFSPDSSAIAFTRSYSEATQDIFTIHLADRSEHQVTDDRRNVFGLAFIDDGGPAVIAASTRLGHYDLWRFPLSDNKPEVVLGGISRPINPTIDHAGQTLVFEERQQDVNLWRITPDGQAAAIASSTTWDIHPTISPDGQWLAFASDRSGGFEVYLAQADGSQATAISALTAHYIGPLSWSADSERLTFAARLDIRSSAYILDLHERRAKLAVSIDRNAANPTFIGHEALLLSIEDPTPIRGGWSLYRVALFDDSPVKVADDIYRGVPMPVPANESPDRRWAVGIAFAGSQLWQINLHSSERQLLPVMIDPGDHASWHVRGSQIYFLERTEDEVWVSRTNFDPSREQKHGISRIHSLGSPIVPRGDGAMTVSPVDASVIFTRMDRLESDLIVMKRAPAS